MTSVTSLTGTRHKRATRVLQSPPGLPLYRMVLGYVWVDECGFLLFLFELDCSDGLVPRYLSSEGHQLVFQFIQGQSLLKLSLVTQRLQVRFSLRLPINLNSLLFRLIYVHFHTSDCPHFQIASKWILLAVARLSIKNGWCTATAGHNFEGGFFVLCLAIGCSRFNRGGVWVVLAEARPYLLSSSAEFRKHRAPRLNQSCLTAQALHFI